MNDLKELFLLDPTMTFLNHGSYGACPVPIFKEYQDCQKQLEKQPVRFLTDHVYTKLENSRIALSDFVGCNQDEIIFFPNPTTAITNVIYNLGLNKGDEVLMSSHEYGALVRSWNDWGKKTQVKIIQQEISLPMTTDEKFVEEFSKGINSKTKVIFLSHITSATALIFPIQRIIEIAKEKGILTIIDGAHVPAHIPLNIKELGCDFYTGACHKWLCGPKGSSFLYVDKKHQTWIRPLVISWGKEGDDPTPSEFLQNFQWQGTRDLSAFLTIPIAIDFYKNVIHHNQLFCKELIHNVYSEFHSVLGTPPISTGGNLLGQMLSHPLPDNLPADLKEKLWHEYKIEIPIFYWQGKQYIRISIQIYNSIKDVELLMRALQSLN